MFRRLPGSIPTDYSVPDTLDGLGLMINDKDQVCSKSDPTELFKWKASPSERYNDMRYSKLLRKSILQQLESIG